MKYRSGISTYLSNKSANILMQYQIYKCCFKCFKKLVGIMKLIKSWHKTMLLCNLHLLCM